MSMNCNRCAIITGIGGQDAHYLSLKLLDEGIRVVGTTRNADTVVGFQEPSKSKNISIIEWDLLSRERFAQILLEFEPNYMFNLAGMSSGADMDRDTLGVAMVNGSAVLSMLETLYRCRPMTKFVQASSAEVFGATQSSPQTEQTCRVPRSAYGVSKVFADGFVKLYRQKFGMQCGSAILYNHESPLREPTFVTRKITSAAAAISVGLMERLLLGNLSAKRDWGHARDYVDGMWRMAQADQIDDYVFATGTAHTVREFVELAFRHVGIELDWIGEGLNEVGICRNTGVVRIAVAEEYFRPLEAELLIGNPARAKAGLGWQSITPFGALVAEMVDFDLKKLSPDLPKASFRSTRIKA
jgi:GDPmannose 4,6-dehydratase